MKEIRELLEKLIKTKAAEAILTNNPTDAREFSQAALNAAQALEILGREFNLRGGK